MSVRDKTAKQAAKSAEVTLDGELCKIQIRRLSAREALAMSDLPKDSRPAELVAATILDEEGQPLFANAAAAEACDWVVFEPLLKATGDVNAVTRAGAGVGEAAKNA